MNYIHNSKENSVPVIFTSHMIFIFGLGIYHYFANCIEKNMFWNSGSKHRSISTSFNKINIPADTAWELEQDQSEHNICDWKPLGFPFDTPWHLCGYND